MRTHAAADDVVQETWLAVIRGLDGFEERSSLRTWIFRILVNRARTRAVREARSLPFSALETDDGPTVDPGRFGADGRWRSAPARLDADPETSLLALSCERTCSRPSSACSGPASGDYAARPRRAAPPMTSARCSRSVTATSACSCTGPGPGSATALLPLVEVEG